MPRQFKMKLDTQKMYGSFSCREVAASNMGAYIYADAERRAIYNDPKAPFTLYLRFAVSVSEEYAANLQAYLTKWIPGEAVFVVESVKDQVLSRYTLDITVSGPVAHVYRALWWSVLFTRIILSSPKHFDFDTTPTDLLEGSSVVSTTHWYDSHPIMDRSNAIRAYQLYDQISSDALYSKIPLGPSAYVAMYYKG